MPALLSDIRFPLTKLPTTTARHDGTYDDLFRMFNSFRQLVNDIDNALTEYVVEAPEDGKMYVRKDGDWEEFDPYTFVKPLIVAGTGVTVTFDDVLKTITISAP